MLDISCHQFIKIHYLVHILHHQFMTMIMIMIFLILNIIIIIRLIYFIFIKEYLE
jgi:hypothetical protein